MMGGGPTCVVDFGIDGDSTCAEKLRLPGSKNQVAKCQKRGGEGIVLSALLGEIN